MKFAMSGERAQQTSDRCRHHCRYCRVHCRYCRVHCRYCRVHCRVHFVLQYHSFAAIDDIRHSQIRTAETELSKLV